MAKQLLKRTPAKPASKKAVPASSRPASRKAAPPTAKAAARPMNGKADAKAVNGSAKPAGDTRKTTAAPAKTVTPVATKPAAKPVNGTTVAAKPSAAVKPVAAAKPANGTPATPVAEAPKTPGRPMLMQGPVASKSLTKKGTFVLSKTPVPAPKPIKRKIDRPEPAFVTLQPPVVQVRTSEKAVKNRAGLSQKDLDFFRDLLLAKRRELVGDMSHMEREALRENNANLSNLPVHMADQGTDAYEQEFTLGLVEKDRTLLREINDAMAKLQNGTYGICEGTGNPIGRPRLEAQPWARHSIEFARILEKRKMVFRR